MTVSLLRCNDYDYHAVRKTIERTFKDLGGIEKFVKKGEKVLLKVNLLMKKKPEEATTTNPVLVRAVADVLIAYGAEVVIGDSPGGPFLEGRMRNIYKASGMEEACVLSGADLNFNLASHYTECKDGLLLNKIVVTDMINDVDKIINLPKLKTHGFAVYTGAVKNLFGLIPGTIKAEYHVRMPDINDFSNALIDICEFVKPVLHIMDGITAMEGAGPSSGSPKDLGVILASENPYELDLVACKLIGLKVEDVPTLRKAYERGLSSGKLEDIEMIGDKLEKCVVSDFVYASSTSGNYRRIPVPVRKLLVNKLKSRPVFNHDICIGCGDCEENCPPKAIVMVKKRPVVDDAKCISCFCCQELCPAKAIDIKKPILAKILFR